MTSFVALIKPVVVTAVVPTPKPPEFIPTLPVKLCTSPESLPKADEPLWKLVVIYVTEFDTM